MPIEQIIAIVVAAGTAAPLLVAAVTRANWPKPVRGIVSILVSGFTGFVTYVGANGWKVSDVAGMIATIGGVAVVSVNTYQTIWKPSGIAERVESATTPLSVKEAVSVQGEAASMAASAPVAMPALVEQQVAATEAAAAVEPVADPVPAAEPIVEPIVATPVVDPVPVSEVTSDTTN